MTAGPCFGLPVEPNSVRSRRFLRLAVLILLVSVSVYLAANLGLAWVYSYALTHPGCNPAPKKLAALPAPEVIWLTSSDGRSLQAWYYPGSNGAGILAAGGMGGALGDSLPPIEFLVREGYSVLQIDTRACATPPAPVTLGGKEVDDLRLGLNFLIGQPDIKRIGVFGFSMGAAATIRLAAAQPEVTAVVAEGGYYNLGNDFTEPDVSESAPRKLFLYCIALSYWVQSHVNPWQISPLDELERLSPRPVFLIYGEHEAGSGRAQLQFSAAKEPKDLWIVPGGDHGSNHLIAPEQYQQKISAFFNRHLLGDPDPDTSR